MDEQIDRHIDGQMEGEMDGQIDGQMKRQMDRENVRQMDGQRQIRERRDSIRVSCGSPLCSGSFGLGSLPMENLNIAQAPPFQVWGTIHRLQNPDGDRATIGEKTGRLME